MNRIAAWALGLALCASGCALFGPPERKYETVTADPHHDTAEAIRKNQSGVDLIARGNWARAEKILQEALIADVTYGPAHNNLGWVYFKQGKYYLAAWEFEYANKLMPDFAEPLNNLGLVHEEVGRNGEARMYYERALSMDPGNPEFLGNLARLRIGQGERSFETAILLEEMRYRDTRPEWQQWSAEHLNTSHKDLLLAGFESLPSGSVIGTPTPTPAPARDPGRTVLPSLPESLPVMPPRPDEG